MKRKKNTSTLSKEKYNKYIAPVIAMEKEQKSNKRKQWWSQNLFNVISSIIAILALFISLISLLLQLK